MASSDVFEAMFRFDAQNAKAAGAAGTAKEVKPVEVPDVEVGAFKVMLAFIYADDLLGLNGDNAIAVLCAANKYDVAGLTKACVDFPKAKLSNVFVALVQARFRGKKFNSGSMLLTVPSGVLTLNQMMSVFVHHSHPGAGLPELYPLKFPTKRRTATKSPGDDPFKANAKITLKIEKVSEFAREDENSRRGHSEAVYIRGLPWKILTYAKIESGRKCLAFFLQCKAGNTDANWSCACSATLRIVSQKKGKKDGTQELSRHIFNSEEYWGYPHFMTFEKLMDPNNGWHDAKNDMVMLAIDLTAEEPTGVK
uniref:MATH domain-containing protein n=1 Tax=Globodera pallida TaxID=36090 RepID=A0A183BTV1_GLOPA